MKYYGLSFSRCIKDVLDGKIAIDEIIFIITGTYITDRATMLHTAGLYMNSCWKGYPLNKLISTIEALFFSGKIIHPRVMRIDPPNIAAGHWVEGDVDDVALLFSRIEYLGKRV